VENPTDDPGLDFMLPWMTRGWTSSFHGLFLLQCKNIKFFFNNEYNFPEKNTKKTRILSSFLQNIKNIFLEVLFQFDGAFVKFE